MENDSDVYIKSMFEILIFKMDINVKTWSWIFQKFQFLKIDWQFLKIDWSNTA